MALDKSQLASFRSEVLKACRALGSNALTYRTEWIFELPTASLSIGGVRLDGRFDIPVGLTGFGQQDLDELVNEGFLTLISVSDEDSQTFEKIAIYRLNI